MLVRDTRTGDEAQATHVSRARKNPCFTCGNPEAKLRKNLPLRFVWPSACTLCGQCWGQFGGKADAAEIGPAPRAALEVRSVGPDEWRPILDAQPWRGELRRDARGKVDSLVSELCRWAGWESGETWPTWDRLMDATGWARATLASWLRQLWILGWIDRVEPGSTPATRPMGSRIEGNRAAVYGMRVPAYADEAAKPALQREYTTTLAQLKAAIAQVKQLGQKNWTPTGSLDPVELRLEVGYLRTRTKKIFHRLGGGFAGGKNEIEPLRGPGFDESKPRLWARTVPTTRAEMLAAAAELRRQHTTLARLSAKAIRSECRSWWRAGWCNDGLLHALRARPVGWSGASTARSHAVYAVIHPAGWVRSRLSIWTTHTAKGLVKPMTDPTLRREIRRFNVDSAIAETEQRAEADRTAYGRIGARLLADARAQAGRYWQPTPGQAAAALTDRIRLDRPAGQPTARDRAVAAVASHFQAKQLERRPRLSPLQQELRDRAVAAEAARGPERTGTGYRPRRDRRGRR
ncbi:hypothetical protein CU254_42460 (plasmid) [Amycolatopsis sp. AA4]|nr:hypothetical protein CU254_42460 [Amycolatopsis sp. AA4]